MGNVLSLQQYRKHCLTIQKGGVSVSDNPEPTPQAVKVEEKKKMTTLLQVEEIVNGYAAKKFAAKYQIPAHRFRVNLVSRLKGGIMGIRAGDVAQIDLKWPEAQPVVNTLLDDAMRFISSRNVLRRVEIVPLAYVRSNKIENRKWHREMFGDEGEILADLLPKHRLEVETTVTMTMKDKMTGVTTSITIPYARASEWSMEQRCRMALSRTVLELYGEQYPEGTDANSELDTALRQRQGTVSGVNGTGAANEGSKQDS